jgi:uncharacterized sulfatase
MATSVVAGLPNLVYVMADDCTYTDLGVYGGQAYTPNLERLAEQGMRFNNCWQSAPMCAPTRMNILTGLYPVRSGAYPNHSQVRPGTQSIVQHLKPLGYRVALVGKSHISPRKIFDFEYYGENKDIDFDAAKNFVRECTEAGTPFCLLLMSKHPHDPWDSGNPSRYPPEQLKLPPHWVDTPETRDCFSRYLAEITVFDEQVGKTMELIDGAGITSNTFLIVTSEQGSVFPYAKWTCYAEGLRSGLLARWPGKIKPETQSDALVEFTDILPTQLEAVGAAPKGPLDGKSFWPVLRGQTDKHKQYTFGIHTTTGIKMAEVPFGIRSVRDNRYSYIRNLHPDNPFQNVINNKPTAEYYPSWRKRVAEGDADAAAKVLRYDRRPPEELYDRENDPLELNNLAGNPEYTDVKARLAARLDEWMEQQGDLGRATEESAADHYADWHRRKLGLEPLSGK